MLALQSAPSGGAANTHCSGGQVAASRGRLTVRRASTTVVKPSDSNQSRTDLNTTIERQMPSLRCIADRHTRKGRSSLPLGKGSDLRVSVKERSNIRLIASPMKGTLGLTTETIAKRKRRLQGQSKEGVISPVQAGCREGLASL